MCLTAFRSAKALRGGDVKGGERVRNSTGYPSSSCLTIACEFIGPRLETQGLERLGVLGEITRSQSQRRSGSLSLSRLTLRTIATTSNANRRVDSA